MYVTRWDWNASEPTWIKRIRRIFGDRGALVSFAVTLNARYPVHPSIKMRSEMLIL